VSGKAKYMNNTMMARMIQKTNRTVQRHLVIIRLVFPDFARDKNGNTYFTNKDAEEYFFILRMSKGKRVMDGVIALIKLKERQQLLSKIDTIVKTENISLLNAISSVQ